MGFLSRRSWGNGVLKLKFPYDTGVGLQSITAAGGYQRERKSVDEVVIVLTNLPDRAAAVKLAQELVARRLAACVNVLAECTSIYRWRGAIENTAEVPVLIKTREARYAEVEAVIRSLHPYELPEIIAVPVRHGLDEYLQWVAGETTIAIG
jgi:periplasmic divalent cation tolerance protein